MTEIMGRFKWIRIKQVFRLAFLKWIQLLDCGHARKKAVSFDDIQAVFLVV